MKWRVVLGLVGTEGTVGVRKVVAAAAGAKRAPLTDCGRYPVDSARWERGSPQGSRGPWSHPIVDPSRATRDYPVDLGRSNK